ncbi:DUF4190 domain-containing protein [Leucobacter sp. W1478]|uniref:DUF4190 domain-containing protein n=1 Tax=Leucobacter sp. W1478 TaxID=3439065 RepID=UPI003F3A4C50
MSTPIPPVPEQQTSALPDSNQFERSEPGLLVQDEQQASYQPEALRPAPPTTLAHMNAYALIAIVLAFIQPIAGIVFGHMGMSQIKRNGDTGRGVALTALIIGYVMIAGAIIAVISYFAFIAIMLATMGAAFSEFDPSGFDDSF